MTVHDGSGRSDGRAALMAAAWQELAESGATGLSLRAVARRAGVSHAAPKHHFGDRTGLLTALAVVGFEHLRKRFEAVTATPQERPIDRVAALGRAYLDFSLAEPVMFDVMFGSEPLHQDDPKLAQQRRSVFGVLDYLVSGADPWPPSESRPVPLESLMAWALIHGLVVLTRDGSLQRVTGTESPAETAEKARALAAAFTERFGAILAWDGAAPVAGDAGRTGEAVEAVSRTGSPAKA
ncbi:TetR/AcrR family transcriptional regulator [Actinoplanes sp. M2I2]|uniref:TetR/AcrR family transcriptional regulator n=1 Tax=Actinoplanes sp. M2I2 TaxID=1734444 RepID=UPI002021D2B3|nr:TetR/AcrR family transcriptional regulator [Actinoplanes sp. M2I2]